MTLIELVDSYRRILASRGRVDADNFLDSVGAHAVIKKAIRSSFLDSGAKR